MKPTKNMSESELREEIAELGASPSIGIAAVTRLTALKFELQRRLIRRFSKMRPELLRVQIERFRRENQSYDLKLALEVAKTREIWLLPELPDGKQYTKRQLHLHVMRPEDLKAAVKRMKKGSKRFELAAPVARMRGLDV